VHCDGRHIQIEYVMTDKTGTLTENEMVFRYYIRFAMTHDMTCAVELIACSFDRNSRKCSIGDTEFGERASALEDELLRTRIKDNDIEVYASIHTLSLSLPLSLSLSLLPFSGSYLTYRLILSLTDNRQCVSFEAWHYVTQ
jgi:magnesium-transporting ATPase (P-type)